MEEKKDNKLLKLILIVLGVIVLCIVGYIVYDKWFNDSTTNEKEKLEKPNNNDNNSEVVEEIDEDKKLDYIVLNYPKTRDSEVTGDNMRKEFDLTKNERHKATFTFNYKNYKIVYNYIDGSADTSEIKIYSNDKEVYSNIDIKTLISFEYNDKNGTSNFLPIISKGKLHLLAYNIKDCYLNEFSEKIAPLEYLQIDLSSDEIKIDTIKSVKFEFATRYIPEGEIRMCE